MGEKFALYRFVNELGLRALNATDSDHLKRVLRPENEKLDDSKFIESDDDDQLILIIPFTGSVRLRKIVIMAVGETCPLEVQIFKNHEIGFDTDLKPTQTIKLGEDPEGELELPVLAPKFNDCRTLSLFFPESVGGDTTKILYIGLFGDHIKVRERARYAGSFR